MPANYWLDVFTPQTWKEFRNAGAKVMGFRETMSGYLRKVLPGDVLLCYVTGQSRWVGALEVMGPSNDRTRIWQDDPFPLRLAVRPLTLLNPEDGVPLADLEGKVAFFPGPEQRSKYRGFLRRSLNRFQRNEDGELLLALLRTASAAAERGTR